MCFIVYIQHIIHLEETYKYNILTFILFQLHVYIIQYHFNDKIIVIFPIILEYFHSICFIFSLLSYYTTN